MFKFATNKISIPKVWMDSFSLYKQTFKSIWYLVVITQLVPIAFAVIAKFIIPVQFNPYLIMIPITIVNLYIVAIIFHRMYNLADKEKYPLSNSIKFAGSKFLHIFTVFLMGLILLIAIFSLVDYLETIFPFLSSKILQILVGTATLISLLGAIFIGLLTLMALLFIIIKNDIILNAWKKSFSYMQSNYWRTFFVILVPSLIFVLLRKYTLYYSINFFKFIFNYFHSAEKFLLLILIPCMLIIAIATALLLPYLKAVLLVQFNGLLQRKK